MENFWSVSLVLLLPLVDLDVICWVIILKLSETLFIIFFWLLHLAAVVKLSVFRRWSSVNYLFLTSMTVMLILFASHRSQSTIISKQHGSKIKIKVLVETRIRASIAQGSLFSYNTSNVVQLLILNSFQCLRFLISLSLSLSISFTYKPFHSDFIFSLSFSTFMPALIDVLFCFSPLLFSRLS